MRKIIKHLNKNLEFMEVFVRFKTSISFEVLNGKTSKNYIQE
jgi:hypothetical protein